MSFSAYTTIAKCLRPDRPPSELERDEAIKALNDYRSNARLRAGK